MNDALSVNMGDVDENPLRNSIEYHRLETESEIEKYDLLLRGYNKKAGTKIWEKKKGAKNRFNMAEEAINYVVSTRHAILSKSALQANFSGKDKWKIYDDIIMNFMRSFDTQLLINGEEWNLGSSQCDSISEEMEEYMRMLLTRPLDNKERDRDKANESFNHHDDMNKDDKMFR